MKPHPKRIASSNNILVREAARLKRKGKRYAAGLFIAEGEDLLEAALTRGVIPERVFVPAGCEEEALARLRRHRQSGGPAVDAGLLVLCPQRVLAGLSALGSGSRAISIFKFLDRPLEALPSAPGPETFLYLEGAADPGNVGTLIRTAAAFGAGGVILGPGSADPYSAKAMRATMGSIFQVSLSTNVDVKRLGLWAAESGLDVIAADPRKGMPAWEADLAGGSILALGAEREGLSEAVLAAAGKTVKIPQAVGGESLNVAMAGSVLLYEGLRQRQKAAAPAKSRKSRMNSRTAIK